MTGSRSDPLERRITCRSLQLHLPNSCTRTESMLLRRPITAEAAEQVEGDYEGAERCYERAVGVAPDDGELLSLYGKLLWEAHEDEEVAEVCFRRAVEASPADCQVLGCYAHFLWDAEEKAVTAIEEGRPRQVSRK